MKSLVAPCLVLLLALALNCDAQLACPGSNVRQCGQDCLRLRETDGGRCLACDTNCQPSDESDEDQPMCESDRSCVDADRVCVASVSDESDRCVTLPGIGMSCVDDLLEERAEDLATDEYYDHNRLDLDREAIPCGVGSVCEGDESNALCTAFNGTGPCRAAQMNDTSVRCRVDAQYKPIQCNNDRTECWCVFPNGTVIAGSRVSNGIPDCRQYYGGCTYTNDGRTRKFPPGSVINQYDAQADICNPCYCFFNTWRCNTNERLPKETCGDRDEPSRNCTYLNEDGERETLPYGMKKRVRCNNTCGCTDRGLVCTSLKCNDDADNDECGRCDNQDVFRPVCANGKQYRSRCHAMYCGNLTAGDFTDRPCTEEDPCTRAPCADRQICVPRRAKCFRREGCAERQRECVSIDTLRCLTTTSDVSVCGTDGVTYESRCQLLRKKLGGTQIRHRSRCDDPNCASATVCDNDGQTLQSECEARERLSRVEYEGNCEDRRDSDTYTSYCTRLRNERCPTLDRCASRIVQPSSGCCRVCGGVLTTRLNDVSLDSFSAVDQDDLLEASGFAKRLLASTFLPALLQESSCMLEVDVTDSRNEMEFIFRDTEMTNRESAGRMCHDIANILECLMNNRTRPTRDNCNVDTDIIDSIPADYTVQEEDPTLSAVTVATSSPVSDLSTGATQGIAITLATVCIAVITALCVVW